MYKKLVLDSTEGGGNFSLLLLFFIRDTLLLSAYFSSAYVKQANVISRALRRRSTQAKSVWCGRILKAVISQVRDGDTPFQNYEVDVASIILGSGRSLRDGSVFKDLINAAKKIVSSTIVLQEENKKALVVSPLSSCIIENINGVLTLKAHFDPTILPYYLELNSHYTQFPLLEYLPLKSRYSQDLYELLKSWSNLSRYKIDIKSLYDYLDVPDSIKRNFHVFRKKILDTALDEINLLTNLRVAVKIIKGGSGGRTSPVSHLEFIFDIEEVKKIEEEISLERHDELNKKSAECYQQWKIRGENCHNRNCAVCNFCRSHGMFMVLGSQIKLPE